MGPPRRTAIVPCGIPGSTRFPPPARVRPVRAMTASLPSPRVLGVPIQDANLISSRLCAGYGRDGTDLLCWTTTAESGGHFCALDLTTGQLDVRAFHHREAYPITPARDGCIYTGSTAGEVWRYHAARGWWEVVATLWPVAATEGAVSHIRVLAEGRDGWLYAGNCHGQRARVHPATGEVQPLPFIAEKGDWYVCSAAPLPDGRIAFGFGHVARVLIYDPALGRDIADWTPAHWRPDGFIITMTVGATVLYANHYPSGRRGAFDLATGKFLGEAPWPVMQHHPKWSHWDHSSGCGNGYDYYVLPGTDTIAACAGATVHLWHPRAGARTQPLAEFQPAATLAREMQFGVTTDLRVLEYSRHRTQVAAQRTLPQPRVERGLFSLGLGPDGCIYGGAFQSMHLFRFDPRTGELRDLGDHHPGWSGEIYSLCARGRELVCCSYIDGAVVLYDPTQPWACDHQQRINPRFVGCLGKFTYRPFACTTDHRGRVWAAGYATWGLKGGGVTWLDPDTGATGTTPLPGAPYFIAELTPGLLLVADETTLHWWDAATNTACATQQWATAPVHDVALLAPDRLAFVTDTHLHFATLAAPGRLDLGATHALPFATTRLLWSHGRLVAGGAGIAEFDPATGTWTHLSVTGPSPRYAFAATRDAVFFTAGPRLLSVPRPT